MGATLYVKMIQGEKLLGSGSGFVIKTTKQETYVVTNCHVAAPDDIKGALTLVGVLHSGTAQEQSLPLEVLGVDPANDLALLRGKGLADPPKPIRLEDGIAPDIGQELSVVGFPFGQGLVLDGSNKNPIVSVSRVTVQRPYHDQFGVGREIPTVGNANHGNSGGPVVDSEGHLAGVLVSAFLLERHGVGIIPVEHVRNLWDGSCQPGEVKLITSYGSKLRAQFTVYRCDPFDTVASARVVVLPADKITPKTDRKELHRLAADYFAQDVEIPPMSGHTLTCKADLPDLGTERKFLAYAVQATRKDGSVWLSSPVPFLYGGAAATVSLALDLSIADPYLRGETPEASASGPDRDVNEAARLAGKLGKTSGVALTNERGIRVLQLESTIKPVLAPLWEANGEAALIVDLDGWLVRLALPSLERVNACRLPACLPSHMGPGARLETTGEARPVALVRSRDRVAVLSRVAYNNSTIGNEAWICLIDPQRLSSIGFFAVPGVVGLSALPDSDRLLVRYFTGELGLLDASTGNIHLLARTRQPVGLPVDAAEELPVIPVSTVTDAVLIDSGNRILIQTEGGAAALEITPDGKLVPPGKQTPIWPGVAAIHYTPGAPAALLAPSPGEKQPTLRSQLLSLPELGATALAPGDWQCLDLGGQQAASLLAGNGHHKVERLDLATAFPTRTSWRRRKEPGQPDRVVGWAASAITPHPRGNAYWVQAESYAYWVEFGPTRVNRGDAGEKEPAPTPSARDTPSTAGALKGVLLGTLGDMTVRQFPLSEHDGTGVGLCWAKDAKAFVAAWKPGIVRRFSLADFAVVRQHDLGKPCLGLGRSALGPVATMAATGGVELAVLDEETLAPLRTAPLPTGSLVSLAEHASIAIAAIPDKGLAVVDLAQGRMLSSTPKLRSADGAGELSLAAVAALAVAPDGRTVYAVVAGQVAVLQVASGRLALAGFIPDGQATGIAVSPDGYYVDVETTTESETHHVIRAAASPNRILRDLRTKQVIFDCGARHLFHRPKYPYPGYPFVGRNTFTAKPEDPMARFAAGEHVIANPRGNQLVALGEELHVLDYTWGCQ